MKEIYTVSSLHTGIMLLWTVGGADSKVADGEEEVRIIAAITGYNGLVLLLYFYEGADRAGLHAWLT